MIMKTKNETVDFLRGAMSDPEVRSHFEREWLADEIIAGLQQKMDELGVTRAELAKRLGCSGANVTKLFRRGTNLTLGSMVDLALALEHRFLAPELVPIDADVPWLSGGAVVLTPARAWVVAAPERVSEAVSASPSVAWPRYAPEGEAEVAIH